MKAHESVQYTNPEERNYQQGLLAEYASLRGEIEHKVQLCNNLRISALTIFAAILAFQFNESGNTLPELCLLPLAILAPIAWRITYYKNAMIKLGTYIATFIEPHCRGFAWESRVLILDNLCSNIPEEHGWFNGSGAPLRSSAFECTDFFFAGAVCLGLYGWQCSSAWETLNGVFLGIGCFFFVLMIVALWWDGNNDLRLRWEQEWKNLADTETGARTIFRAP